MPKDTRSINERKAEQITGLLIMENISNQKKCACCQELLGYLWLSDAVIEDKESGLVWCDTVCHDDWIDKICSKD